MDVGEDIAHHSERVCRCQSTAHVHGRLLSHLGARRGEAVGQDAAGLLAVDARVIPRVHGRLAAALALAQVRRHQVLGVRCHDVVHVVACATVATACVESGQVDELITVTVVLGCRRATLLGADAMGSRCRSRHELQANSRYYWAAVAPQDDGAMLRSPVPSPTGLLSPCAAFCPSRAPECRGPAGTSSMPGTGSAAFVGRIAGSECVRVI